MSPHWAVHRLHPSFRLGLHLFFIGVLRVILVIAEPVLLQIREDLRFHVFEFLIFADYYNTSDLAHPPFY